MGELGGNSKFSAFLEKHAIPEDMPIRQKYNTRAAEWYRLNLRALAEKTEPPEPLVPGTGHLPCEGAGSPEQLMLDEIFAKAPKPDDMTSGGILIGAARGTRNGSNNRFLPSPWIQPQPAESRVKKRAREERGEEEDL